MANNIFRDFFSEERRDYKYKLGSLVASSLTGFIFGVVAATVIWMIALNYIQSLSAA